MGKYVSLILTIVFFLTNPVSAACIMDGIGFGDNKDRLEKRYDAPFRSFSKVEDSETLVSYGTMICPGKKTFDGTTIAYKFISNKLVQVSAYNDGGDTLAIFKWAQFKYGKAPRSSGEIEDLASEFYWDKSSEHIFYAFEKDHDRYNEIIEITSKRHNYLFESYNKNTDETGE